MAVGSICLLWFNIFRLQVLVETSSFIFGVPWGCHHEAPSPNRRHGGSVTLSGCFPCITPQHGALSRDMCETPHRGSPPEKEAEQGRPVTSLEPLYPEVLEVSSRISASARTALALFVSPSSSWNSVTYNWWSPNLSSILFEK